MSFLSSFTALMADRDHVIGGDRATWHVAVMDKFTDIGMSVR